MGRMLTFLARIQTDEKDHPVVRGVAVDETTALLLDYNTGIAKTVGENFAFLCSSDQPPKTCQPNEPLTFESE